VQSSSQIITTNKPTPSFLQARCPFCHPTNSVKALKGKISHSTVENCTGTNVQPDPCPSPSLPKPSPPRTRNFQAHPRPYPSVSNPSTPVPVIYNPSLPLRALPATETRQYKLKAVKTNGLVHQNFKKTSPIRNSKSTRHESDMSRQTVEDTCLLSVSM